VFLEGIQGLRECSTEITVVTRKVGVVGLNVAEHRDSLFRDMLADSALVDWVLLIGWFEYIYHGIYLTCHVIMH